MGQRTSQKSAVIYKGQKIKKLMPIDTEPGRLVNCMEEVSFSYSKSDSQEIATTKNLSGNKKGTTSKTNGANDVTANLMRNSVYKMVLAMIQLIRTLHRMPEEHIVLMKLQYHDDVTATDYEPPFFRSCSEQEANKQRSQNPNREVLDQMMKANAKLQQQLGDQKKVISEVEGEIRASQSNLTLEELSMVEAKLRADTEKREERLSKLWVGAAAMVRMKTGRQFRNYMWSESVSGDSLRKCLKYVLEELNIRSIVTCNDPLKYAKLHVEPDFSVLGKRIGKAAGSISEEVKAKTREGLPTFEKAGEVTFAGYCLKLSDIKIVLEFKKPENSTEIDAAGDGDVLVVLDLRVEDSLVDTGVAREIVNRVQKLRKKSGLEPTDLVEAYFESLDKDESLLQVLKSQETDIKNALGSSLLPYDAAPTHAIVFSEEKFEGIAGGHSFVILLARCTLDFDLRAISELCLRDEGHAQDLQTMLLSRDRSNLKAEFQLGNSQVVPYLLKFMDNLAYIYVRFNRKRLSGRTGEEDCRTALSTLYVLLTTCKVMAPFTPFFTEVLYQNMRKVENESLESIHYCSFLEARGKRDERIEQSVTRMMTVIDLSRSIRECNSKPLKTPLREMVVVHPDAGFLEDIDGKLREPASSREHIVVGNEEATQILFTEEISEPEK